MKKFKVKTPKNPAFAGNRHGVQFRNGEAVAEFPEHAVNEFKSWGYEVEEIVEEAPKPKKTAKKTEK